MLVENLIISGLGACTGVLLAFSGVGALLPLFAERGDPAILVHLDGHVLVFAIAVCILTTLLFSIQPAFGAMRWKDLPALQNRTNSAARSRGSLLGGIFVVWQVALSLMLVSGATLLIRSLLNLRHFDPGFSRDNVLFVRIDPVSAGYEGSRTATLDRGLLQEVRAIPGVFSASMSDLPLMGGKNQTCCILVPEYTPATGERMEIRTLGITPGYFGTVGMELISGRDFANADSGSKPSRGIVNETFAKRYFGKHMAVGKSFNMGSKDAVQIIGIVKDARYDGIRADVPPMVFFSGAGDEGTMWSLQVRTAVDPRNMETTIRRAIGQVDPRLPVSGMITVKSLIVDSLAEERLLASLSSVFGLLGLGMATIGVYGLISANVGHRTNEIGIRMALGADRHQIATMILRQTMSLVLLGSAIGLAASLTSSRLLSSFLFDITATNGWTFGISCAVLLSAGLVAGYFPARRAAKVDPMVALRYE
jgi:predicted permease